MSSKNKTIVVILIIVAIAIIALYKISTKSVNSENTSKVPNLIGLSKKEAKDVLKNLNLEPQFFFELEPDKPDNWGNVVKQNPEAGALLPDNNIIELWISERLPLLYQDIKKAPVN